MSKKASKEWWQSFFIPVIGEVMFNPRLNQATGEAQEIIDRTKLVSKSRVLDLACGVGRHAVIFAKMGFEVTGLDFSKHYLAEAKKFAKKSKLDIQFVHGDMKNLKPHFDPNSYDLVVSLYNSFGYFKKRSDDLKMLKEVYRVLKPGGKFVVNTLNGNAVFNQLAKPVSVGREPIKNVFMIDAARFDKSKQQSHAQWTIIDARKTKVKVHRVSFQQNVYTHHELKRMLRKAGFKIESVWGMLGGGIFSSKKTWHQTLVARKPT